MRIWIDISNAPHVNFFKQFIQEWQEKHDVVVTARPLSNTLDLLKKNNISYNCVGAHYGKRKISKIIGFFKRSNDLCRFLKSKSIDVAISQSSFYSPYVAKKLGIPCIYTNDNEFAKGNYIGFLLAQHVLLPEPLESWVGNRFFKKRAKFYPGIKEGIYIQPLVKTDENGKKVVYFRPEPWHAQYHDFAADMFDSMLVGIAEEYEIIILPRDGAQRTHFQELSEQHPNISVPDGVETVETISKNCDVFLGAGGSMTREFALMGIPTVSMYQGTLLEVDKYLISKGLLTSQSDPRKVTCDFLNKMRYDKKRLESVYKTFYRKGQNARELIHSLVQAT